MPTAPTDPPEPIVTRDGRVLTSADIEALADEAERGYCVVDVDGRPCFKPLPCPLHGRDVDVPAG